MVAMSRYCVDTVAYSHFKRGEPRTAALLDSAEWIGIPVIVLGELFAAFERGKLRSRNIAELEKFLSVTVVEVLPVDRRTAEIFGAMVAELKLRGRPIPTNDIWIAAAAVKSGSTLITWDTHFREIPLLGALILET
jgi:tRNA(fMet)-specific endonuclease VapC